MGVDTTKPPAADAPKSKSHHIHWQGPDLLDLADLDRQEMVSILGRARIFEESRRDEVLDILQGRRVGNLFFEDSTRTRVSFTTAVQRLGGTTIDLTGIGSSLSKGETLVDTAVSVEAGGADALVVRTKPAGGAHLIAHHAKVPVINAGDGRHQHPTQGLLDCYALARALHRNDFSLQGLTVAIVGDIANSRVARSDAIAMKTLGARVVLAGPRAFVPPSLKYLDCELTHDLDELLPEVDAVQMLRVQTERHGNASMPITKRQYRDRYALTPDRAQTMKPGSIVMHPGPANRGLEIDGPVADNQLPRAPRSIIREQVQAGTYVRMAVLAMAMGR